MGLDIQIHSYAPSDVSVSAKLHSTYSKASPPAPLLHPSEHEMFHNGMKYGQFHIWSIFHIPGMVTFHACQFIDHM